MNPETAAAPAISLANVVALLNAATALVAVVAAGFTAVALLAVWRMGKGGARAYFGMFERLQVLQLLTVMLVVASATVLALLGVLNSNGITGILSGVAGYVLGGLSGARPDPVAPANTTPVAAPDSASPGPMGPD